METTLEDFACLIRDQCPADWSPEVFSGRIIVHVAVAGPDFRTHYQQVKKQIIDCIRKNYPEREAELWFEVSNASWNCSFKIGKTMRAVDDFNR